MYNTNLNNKKDSPMLRDKQVVMIWSQQETSRTKAKVK